eukprot:TRINITY_DN24571_c0_g1_i1.p1 TRINITY_DN24571_c0_g1~~TRINITY_DN24571_c0_g1_i1.p1  ORF type:complete len:204 (+),score=20.91 TRINITY_DN24571_c0_g1_i1:83-613(+)
MPAYHSKFNRGEHQCMYGCALLPLRTRFRGPAPSMPDNATGSDAEDIVDEAIRSFRWNILFKNFEVLGPADRVLIYLTLWIQKCLFVAFQAPNPDEAVRQLESLAASEIPGPGDPKFLLGPLFLPGDARDAQTARNYLKQLRQETFARMSPLMFIEGQQNKHWFMFSKKRFMNIAF